MAAPLTALTSTKVRLEWSGPALAAFNDPKARFTSAPILVQPAPGRQFMVEVDASAVGAVLSQRFLKDGKIHPCAFFSHRLSPMERNYDIGNRELLAVKLAFGGVAALVGGVGSPFRGLDQPTRIWNMSGRQSGLIPGKHGGPCFLSVSTSCSPTAQGLKTSIQIPCLVNSAVKSSVRLNPFCLRGV